MLNECSGKYHGTKTLYKEIILKYQNCENSRYGKCKFSDDVYTCSFSKRSRAHEKTEEILHCTQHVGRTWKYI